MRFAGTAFLNHTSVVKNPLVDRVVIEVWIALGLAQLALVSLIAAGVFAWRWRVSARRCQTLITESEDARTALEAGAKLLASHKPARSWADELDDRIEALADAASQADRVRLMVLRHERDGDPIEVTDSGGTAEIDALREQLEQLRNQPPPSGAALPAERENELKALVQQFTHDSREMLSCIQNLESENNGLRNQLAEATRSAA